ncbi:MAG: magnesium transporter [Actinomycetota bacterium]|nr:magnesium transporter [Actinomycetota bacterium]
MAPGPPYRGPVPGSERWIDLCDPDDAALEAALSVEVHETALARLRAPARHDDEPRPRLEAHGNYVFGVLVLPTIDENAEATVHELDVVATLDRLVTVRKTPPGGSACDISAIRETALRNDNPPGLNLYYLFDEIAEQFLTVVDRFDDEIDELEDNIGEWPAQRVRENISHIRHEILEIRRALAPSRDAARAVLDDRVELDGEVTLFPRDIELHFADAYDKLLRATDGLDLARDLLSGVRDFHQAQVANDQNEVMKRLTVVASVLLLPTFIVGLYGQNLKGVPEFGWSHGYLWSWSVIVATTIAQLVYFRRKRWI